MRKLQLIDIHDSSHRGPFHTVILSSFHNRFSGHVEDLVLLLLDRFESDVNCQDRDGSTPLHVAIEYSNESIVEVLLRCVKVNLQLENSKGLTPVLLAADCTLPRIVRMLLNRGAIRRQQRASDIADILRRAANRGDTYTEAVLKVWHNAGNIDNLCLPSPEDIN